jgi:hypothetical protein
MKHFKKTTSSFLISILLVFLIAACDQQNSKTAVITPTPKPTDPEPQEPLFDFYGFSPCTAATRDDIKNIYSKIDATDLKTTIDKDFEYTTIEGKIGSNNQSFKLSVTLWNGKILSLSTRDYSSKFTAEINKNYGPSVDEVNENKGNITINKIIYKNPRENISLSFNTLNLSGYKSNYFVFNCIPLYNEYENKYKTSK